MEKLGLRREQRHDFGRTPEKLVHMLQRYFDVSLHRRMMAQLHERRSSVVDPQPRVDGVRGLGVRDTSVLPEITGSHTGTSTIVRVEECADILGRALDSRFDGIYQVDGGVCILVYVSMDSGEELADRSHLLSSRSELDAAYTGIVNSATCAASHRVPPSCDVS